MALSYRASATSQRPWVNGWLLTSSTQRAGDRISGWGGVAGAAGLRGLPRWLRGAGILGYPGLKQRLHVEDGPSQRMVLVRQGCGPGCIQGPCHGHPGDPAGKGLYQPFPGLVDLAGCDGWRWAGPVPWARASLGRPTLSSEPSPQCLPHPRACSLRILLTVPTACLPLSPALTWPLGQGRLSGCRVPGSKPGAAVRRGLSVGVCPRTCACLCACVCCGCSCTPVYAQACIPPCNSMPVHTWVLPVGQSRDKRLLRTPFGELCPSCDSEGSCTPRVSVKGHFYLPV